jgi:hypothetical protein
MILFSFILWHIGARAGIWHTTFCSLPFLHRLQYGDIIHHHSTHSPALAALRRMHLQ